MEVLRLRAVAELENNQSEKSFEDVKLILYLANLDHPEPWHQKLRTDGILAVLQPVWQGLVDHQWSDTQLSAIEKELARFDFLSDYQYCVRCWCAVEIEGVDSMEQRRIHDFRAKLYFGPDQNGDSLWKRVFDEDILFDFMPKGWFYENDVALTRLNLLALRTDAEVDKRIISSKIAKRFRDARALYPRHSPCNYMVWGHSDFELSAQKFAFAQSSLDQARIACALERHRLATGEYPATLDALIPRFMEKLPHDIINDQPLHYRRTGDGRFLLYSVGWNGTDDGGIVGRQKTPWLNNNRKIPDRKIPLDKSSGDWVWPNPE
jgi:hypothetical protein